MSKITNDDLTRCSTGCFMAVFTWQQWASWGGQSDETDSTQGRRRLHVRKWSYHQDREYRWTVQSEVDRWRRHTADRASSQRCSTSLDHKLL